MKKTQSLLSLLSCALFAACASPRATFATPEEAVQRLAAAAEDHAAAEELLGPGGFSMLKSGDDVADRADVEAVRELIAQKLAFEDVGEDCKIALLGNDGWELPIPLVREGSGWRFDVEAGREEIVNRRVGRNEISTVETLRALVEAQQEYASVGRDNQPPRFADRFASTPGLHDGLWWQAAEGEPESPLGPLVAEAAEDGYRRSSDQKPTPYHGYLFRLLTEQGAAAPGGARPYLDNAGRLTQGFAYVAWPVSYGDSGVMTFLVNRQGIVFEKDLGADTAKVVAAMKAFEPDATWTPTVE